MKIQGKKIELLAPAGNFEKLSTAIYFGADAVYFGGKGLNLRAFADNFDEGELKYAIDYCHKNSRKAYITLNASAHNVDFEYLKDYLDFLSGAGADAVIVSDLGVADYVCKYGKGIGLHISTQANVTNKYSAQKWVELGAKRIILARELGLGEIEEIGAFLDGKCELEAFVHGAMCVSYSGRCLLSNYLTGRSANGGACAQVCRWNFAPAMSGKGDGEEQAPLEMIEDERGAYILNSKDLCLIKHLDGLFRAGVTSFKIEGRMKTAYYVANTVNAYRRAIDFLEGGNCYSELEPALIEEVNKASHRTFSEGFLFGRSNAQVDTVSAATDQSYAFVGVVNSFDAKAGTVSINQRNRFCVGDTLEVLSPNEDFNKTFRVAFIKSAEGKSKEVASLVMEEIEIASPDLTTMNLKANDILRKKI